jgi:uncharacterized membrane protein YphA (DoxX/SURF4 family)
MNCSYLKMIKRVGLFFFFLLFCVPGVSAHVGYVAPEEEHGALFGQDFAYLLSVIRQEETYIAGGILLVLAGIFYYLLTRVALIKRIERNIEDRVRSYDLFISWIIRLALGITFIGAGVSNTFVSPVVLATGGEAFFEVLIGFLFLAGFFLTPAALSAIILFFIAYSQESYLAGNLDILALLLSFVILANGKPGIDDLVGIPQATFVKRFKKYVPLILRIGLGGAMIYLAVYEKLLNPHWAEQVVFDYNLTSFLSVTPALWVLGAGVIEFLVGLLLFFGFKTRLVGVIALSVLSVSFFFFGEEVYSHVTLFSSAAILFITDSGDISIDHFLKRKHKRFAIWR